MRDPKKMFKNPTISTITKNNKTPKLYLQIEL